MGGIVNCSAYGDGGRKIGDVRIDDVGALLAGRADVFVWIGLYEPDEPLLRLVQQEFGLHDLAVEDAHRAHQRPKLEEYGDSIFVVLRTARWDDTIEGIALGETQVFVGPRFVVSVRHGASLPYTDVRLRCESTPRCLSHGPGFVLYAIMDFVVDQYFPLVDDLESALEALEQQIFSGTPTRETTTRIYELKSGLLMLKRAASPLIDVCNRLLRFDVALIDDETKLYFRDVYDHVVRVNETVDTLRELLTGALEAHLALVSVQQNETMKKLAAWAAIAAVPTAIAGIYGMNFEFIPELHLWWGYPACLALIVGTCTMLYAQFRKVGWL